MSLKVLEDVCIGCGACDFSCPTGALTKTDTFLGLFTIDPFTCNDCGQCVPKCPEQAIVADPEWPVCGGHGCPLTSKRKPYPFALPVTVDQVEGAVLVDQLKTMDWAGRKAKFRSQAEPALVNKVRQYVAVLLALR